MATHNETGKEGEKIAAEYFENKGYEILHTNWRWRHLEIDLIATKDRFLHFIEVKTRKSDMYGPPEAKASRKKLKHLQDAAAAYLQIHPMHKRIQFDVLAIRITAKGNFFRLIEDNYVW